VEECPVEEALHAEAIEDAVELEIRVAARLCGRPEAWDREI